MRADAEALLPPQYLDCLRHIDQPFFTPVYDFCSPNLVFNRVTLVGDAASTPRPHLGFGVSKAGAEAQALAEALANYDDIDRGCLLPDIVAALRKRLPDLQGSAAVFDTFIDGARAQQG